MFQSIRENIHKRTVNHSLETIYYGAPILWAKLLPEYKLAVSLNNFKRKMSKWKGENCQCWSCKT